MVWVRIDDDFPEHPKIAEVGPVGMALQVAGLAYCNRNLTDGFIPFGVAETLIAFSVSDADGRRWQLARTCGMTGDDLDARWAIGLLLGAGIWEDAPGGYQVHDFDQYQPPRKAVLAEREKTAERVKRHRNAKRNADSNPVTNAPVTGPPVPVPEPVPKTKIKSVAPTDVGIARQDLVFEALCEVEGIDWHTANEREHGRIKQARHLAAQSKASPEDIRRAAERWPEVMGDATRTAIGVMSRFQQLLNGPARSNGRQTGAEQAMAYAEKLRREGR